MLLPFFLITSFPLSFVSGCPDHTGRQRGHLSPLHIKPQAAILSTDEPITDGISLSELGPEATIDWSYDASYDWGAIRPAYATCQTGTQQSPIGLSLANGSSPVYQPTFTNYNRNVRGEWTNWNYGPLFTLDVPNDDYTSLPAMRFNNRTVYLSSWHTHAPSEHTVDGDGDRTRAEMHLVHVDANGDLAAVLGILLDPGTTPFPFLAQIPPYIPFTYGPSPRPIIDPATGKPVQAEVVEDVEMNMALALEGVDNVNNFWTYKGSLTTPPCSEGLRWFVAQTIAYTSVEQMQALLGVSTFSAREVQEVWQHDVNSP
ncbi:MAG: hypothetical protein Q9204_005260 [Flavoplaca sp. TL-2023a]